MLSLPWFTLGALFFGLWGLANTWVTVARYGWDQGMYLWFCNPALIATAVGLWRRDRSLLLAFLGVATFTHPLYVWDSLAHLTTGTNLFAAAEFMYQPGMGMGEFLLSRYHYFVLPVMVFAIFRLPKTPLKKTFAYVAFFQVAIFGLSYLFPISQNVNCIHESCFDSLEYKGAAYSLIFFALVASGNFLFSWLWDGALVKAAEKPQWQMPAVAALGVCLAAGLALMGLDVWYKSRLPKLTCAPPFEDSGVRVQCLYTLEHDPKLMELTYSIENKLDVSQYCDTRGDMLGEYEEFKEGLYLRPKEKFKLKALVPYPAKDATLKVAASCLRLQ